MHINIRWHFKKTPAHDLSGGWSETLGCAEKFSAFSPEKKGVDWRVGVGVPATMKWLWREVRVLSMISMVSMVRMPLILKECIVLLCACCWFPNLSSWGSPCRFMKWWPYRWCDCHSSWGKIHPSRSFQLLKCLTASLHWRSVPQEDDLLTYCIE